MEGVSNAARKKPQAQRISMHQSHSRPQAQRDATLSAACLRQRFRSILGRLDGFMVSAVAVD